jgi:hypothetical protein
MHAFGTTELIEIAERVYKDDSAPVSSVSREQRAAKTSRLA